MTNKELVICLLIVTFLSGCGGVDLTLRYGLSPSMGLASASGLFAVGVGYIYTLSKWLGR